MKYFLDSNTCIYYLKGSSEALRKNLQSVRPSDIYIPAVVKAELLYGVQKSNNVKGNINKLGMFLLPFEIVPFSDAASVAYAHIRAELEKVSTPIGSNDLMIASTTIAESGILVTHNTKEFERIPELEIVDWTKPSPSVLK